MRLQDLHELPKTRDSLSFLYIEHGRIDREDKAIAIHDEQGITPVPCATLSLLMLGPGTRVLHDSDVNIQRKDAKEQRRKKSENQVKPTIHGL